jgi:hypothetical protein
MNMKHFYLTMLLLLVSFVSNAQASNETVTLVSHQIMFFDVVDGEYVLEKTSAQPTRFVFEQKATGIAVTITYNATPRTINILSTHRAKGNRREYHYVISLDENGEVNEEIMMDTENQIIGIKSESAGKLLLFRDIIIDKAGKASGGDHYTFW